MACAAAGGMARPMSSRCLDGMKQALCELAGSVSQAGAGRS